MFTHQNYAIYVLDDYAVHLMYEMRQVLWKRGYIIIGGGIAGFVQVNDTHLHRVYYCVHYCFKSFKGNPGKVPLPGRNEMMKLLNDAKKDVKTDESSAFKSLWVTNAFNGPEDYLVSDKIFDLVAESMRSFRSDMIQISPPNTIK